MYVLTRSRRERCPGFSVLRFEAIPAGGALPRICELWRARNLTSIQKPRPPTYVAGTVSGSVTLPAFAGEQLARQNVVKVDTLPSD